MAKTIAIVEDEPAIRENYADLFRRHGFHVDTDDERASESAALQVRLPELAILDIALDDEFDGGFEPCRELRGRSATITSHVSRIRRKFFEVDPAFDAIEAAYGAGYRWLSQD